MELKLTLEKEPVYLSEVVFDGQTEQGVEFDYVLPDYYPDIFKILKCTLTPRVTSFSVSGSQLFSDGVVYIKVLYLTQDSNQVHCIDQRYTYSKTVELGKKSDGAIVSITPKTDYVNCRAVSGRRIDVRGAVSCKIKVSCKREGEVITDVRGLGTETRKTALSYCGEKLSSASQFVSREDIETGSSKTGSISIIHTDAVAVVTDYRVVPGKVIIKGEVQVKALYLASGAKNEQDGESAEILEATIPVSQIIELPGVTEKHLVFVTLSVMDCDLEQRPGDSNENRTFSCDLTLLCNVAAHLEHSISPVSDLYSTEYETSFNTGIVKTETMPQLLNEQIILKSVLESGGDMIAEIFDARADVSNLVYRVRDNSELVVTGQAAFQLVGRLDSGAPAVIDKTEPFEAVVPVAGDANVDADYTVEPNIQVSHVNFTISSDSHADIRATLSLTAAVYRAVAIGVVRDVDVDKDRPKEKSSDYALKLYYAEESEEVWGIAKRYNTSAGAIISGNDLPGNIIEQPITLLIPIA